LKNIKMKCNKCNGLGFIYYLDCPKYNETCNKPNSNCSRCENHVGRGIMGKREMLCNKCYGKIHLDWLEMIFGVNPSYENYHDTYNAVLNMRENKGLRIRGLL